MTVSKINNKMMNYTFKKVYKNFWPQTFELYCIIFLAKLNTAAVHQDLAIANQLYMSEYFWAYRRAFFEGYRFRLKESSRKQFSQNYISLQSAIRVTIGFLIIFGETNFVELWKSTKFAALEKVPYGNTSAVALFFMLIFSDI